MALITDISCRLPRPDIAQLSEDIRAEFSKRLLGGAPVYPLSSEDILAFVMAGTTNLMWGMIHQVLVENDPTDMCCDNLVRYAARRGIHLAGATRAKGYVAITGTPNAVIPATLRFVGESSREYKNDPGVTFNPVRLDASGAAVLRVVSTLAGSQFNVDTGTEIMVSSTTPNIDSEALVIGNGITGGTNDEDCENLRKRVLAAEAVGAVATNRAWYIEKTMQYPGVTRVCFDECGDCCDPFRMEMYPFMDGIYGDLTTPPYGVPPCEVLDAMNDWLWGPAPGMGMGLAPVGMVGAYRRARATVVEITFQCVRACEEAMRQEVDRQLRPVITGDYCVGSKICKSEVTNIGFLAGGREACFLGVEFCAEDGGIRYQDPAWAYIDCGRFPVLGEVKLGPCRDQNILLRGGE